MATNNHNVRSTITGPAAESLAGGGPERVGSFRFYFDDQRWEWSPQVQKMHGYAPGTVTPTTELVLSHKHPDDYRQISETIELIRQTRQAFSSRHRIRDTQGHVHQVVVVGDELLDDHGRVIGTQGFYIDVTPEERARDDALTAEVAQITSSRAAIEQAKGMLMVIYGISAQGAFDLLKWRSQEANLKLRRIAEYIVAAFTEQSRSGELPSRTTFDQLLLTAHLRSRSHHRTRVTAD
jgi:PAS domain S-box-containing protein